MTPRRTYGDRCGVARALDLVGERWGLLVVRGLLFGPKRFTDLQVGLPNVSPDVLAQRLRELEESGIVRRRRLPPPASARVYELTGRGHELEPVIVALGRWGSTAPGSPGDARLGVDSLVLALKTLFDPSAADGFDATFELRVGEQHFWVQVADGRLELGRGDAVQPVAAIEADSGTFAALLWQGLPLSASMRSGDLQIEGSVAAVTRFLRLFPLPPQP